MRDTSPFVIIPVNGLGNRLRAISAASSLARMHGRQLIVAWQSDDFLSDQWHDLFENSKSIRFMKYEEAQAKQLIPQVEIPLYIGEDKSCLTLRGYDKGEQRYIKSFSRKIRISPKKAVVIQAGDCFHPKATSVEGARKKLIAERRMVYSDIFLSDNINLAAAQMPPSPFIGLSLRGSDLRHAIPEPDVFLEKVIRISRRKELSNVYVSSECLDLRKYALGKLGQKGLKVYLNPQPTGIDSESAGSSRVRISGINALIDFIVLKSSVHYVGPYSSSYATEIAASRDSYKSSTLIGAPFWSMLVASL